MCLRVVSEVLSLDEISGCLGGHPNGRTRSGRAWPRGAGAPGTPGWTGDLAADVLTWGIGFAESVGRLTATSDAAATPVIIQEIRDLDDTQAKGVWLAPDLVRWMATATAGLDLDQYVHHLGGEPD
jgi:hypothetical protein